MDAGVQKVLASFTDAATKAFGDSLRSIVLFGSAAEDRLRPVSDVNVLVVLRTFDPAAAERLRDELRLARAAVALRPMFVAEAELPDAVELFATKFADIRRRHRVLVGDDPFDKITVSRAARVRSLRRTLLNLSMRLRERFASVPADGHAAVLAAFAPTVRTAAAEWLALRDGASPTPREALSQAARELGDGADASALETMSAAREGGDVQPAQARDALLRLSALVGRLATAAAGLAP
jgi:predicted nucleotidyltransferase